MTIKVYNKLVRDNIPTILKQKGIEADAQIVKNDQAYKRLLCRKLIEEAREAAVADETHLLEELGDIETVIDALLDLNNSSRVELEVIKDQKDARRGRFIKRIFLKTTTEGGA
ncbi:hypothetical protein A2631_04560 [Candidatus Daviesbacteria bacterium RIFCSPHIGHO2_01_FULL_44_29]|uniref:Phosphoribosyl-ATP pyrophosphohydrolase n=1 Tax=Candidatus Daviesbacteria bacterium RIFCSPHIGHO2_02_FULL_43_12 TaxID=1797776 RepID=A0A1F5KGB6_9BACT|nr:MAG: hypothetical protein A2631_04560 [Candidatus Daviesbacteria bacterium RIFCSPHIGHO2_01_FULL_44_29]OGE39611.1 MAG: hypothetical protein A3E86_05715 [Candidatus Daviesbacteria bacterium RIFCSPHIGHO2_12_FULL_47_45]OGE39993.1 MAG: hypothetical protein A3D25_04290 [Candidatus Daviesbacteria bacterium RIFCSPHIGHO2_02_FULL_43_12]OGE70326.1 MAG: hypothetical protein A3B55_01280 [Candidatus Daviesbacteria bacterium RIFCSPLOWO2_01_FULL_43_15]